MATNFQEIIDQIKASAEKLVTLEIMTGVGEVTIKTTGNGNVQKFDLDIPANYSAKAIYSQVDLVQGDIKTLFHKDFMTQEHEELRTFHRAREAQGHDIIRQNITMLRELKNFIKELMEDDKPGNEGANGDTAAPANPPGNDDV